MTQKPETYCAWYNLAPLHLTLSVVPGQSFVECCNHSFPGGVYEPEYGSRSHDTKFI
jgi:hypothetical protein